MSEYVVVNVDVLIEAAEALRIPAKDNQAQIPAKAPAKGKAKPVAPPKPTPPPKGVMTPGEVAGLLIGLASAPRVGAQVQVGPPEKE